jgi:cell division protein FtsB
MSLAHEIQRRALSALTPVICACTIGYFAYHAMEGERGLQAYSRLTAQITESRAILAATTAERRRMEAKVALLRTNGLDMDVLDELARSQLGLARPDELIILRK